MSTSRSAAAPAWGGILVFGESLADHEVEPSGEPSGAVGCANQQLATKQAVGTVLRLTREIELGGQHATARRLHLDMDMAGAAGIDSGHDAAQPIPPFRIRELMAAQAETGIVVLAFGVGLPEIQQRARERFGGAGQDQSDQVDRLARHALLLEFNPLL